MLYFETMSTLMYDISNNYVPQNISRLFSKSNSIHPYNRPSDRVWKKMENYAEIFGNIMQKKVTIMRKRHQIMRKLVTSYREFNSFMTCLTFAAIHGQVFLRSIQFFHSFFSEA